MEDPIRLETARILSRYRRLVLLGRARLPLDAARRLVGPDCAYHLYHRSEPVGSDGLRAARTASARRSAGRRRRRTRAR